MCLRWWGKGDGGGPVGQVRRQRRRRRNGRKSLRWLQLSVHLLKRKLEGDEGALFVFLFFSFSSSLFLSPLPPLNFHFSLHIQTATSSLLLCSLPLHLNPSLLSLHPVLNSFLISPPPHYSAAISPLSVNRQTLFLHLHLSVAFFSPSISIFLPLLFPLSQSPFLFIFIVPWRSLIEATNTASSLAFHLSQLLRLIIIFLRFPLSCFHVINCIRPWLYAFFVP